MSAAGWIASIPFIVVLVGWVVFVVWQVATWLIDRPHFLPKDQWGPDPYPTGGQRVVSGPPPVQFENPDPPPVQFENFETTKARIELCRKMHNLVDVLTLDGEKVSEICTDEGCEFTMYTDGRMTGDKYVTRLGGRF